MRQTIRRHRDYMKGYSVKDFDDPENDFNSSDQNLGIEPPLLQKEHADNNKIVISLPVFDETILKESNIMRIIQKRRSRRRYKAEPISMVELSFLLWATQGVQKIDKDRVWTLRTVPSAGGRHPYETYLIVNNIDGLENGIYRYLALEHQLLSISHKPGIRDEVYRASYKEDFIADSPVCFVWSCIPYRGEWRYNSKAHKSMLLDAGHICHSLYLSAESIGCGVCALGGYYQKGFDDILGLDGTDEFTVYLASVGKLA